MGYRIRYINWSINIATVGVYSYNKLLQNYKVNIWFLIAMSGSKNPYERLVDRLIRDGIKMVAVDFDLTLVSVHTNGTWMFTARPLASRVRPGFPEFLSEVLRRGLSLAIVTFSPQVELVRDVLRTVLSEKDVEKICIRGNTSDWKPCPSQRKEGKLARN